MEDLVFKTLEWHVQFKACNTRAENDRVPHHVRWIKQGRKVRWIRKEGARVLGGVFEILLEVLSMGLLAMVHRV
ncbi:unnamed protein product [Prunus armeniaca]